MIKLIILLAVVGIVIYGIVAVRRQLKANKAAREEAAANRREDPFKRAAPVSGDPRVIRVGDMVEISALTYAVRGTARYTEGPYKWVEHFLDDGSGTKRWLSVEDDEGDLEVILWTGLPANDLSPDDRVITFDGVQYRLDEAGTAMYVTEGTTDLGVSGTVEYRDFRAPGDRFLSFERFGGPEAGWEAGTGTLVPDGLLTHYPVTSPPDTEA